MTDLVTTTTLTDTIGKAFENHLSKLNANSAVRSMRVMAMENFLNMGFPDKKNEEYKYTPIASFIDDSFGLESNEQIEIPLKRFKKLLPLKNAHVIVLINGVFSDEHSQLIPTDSSIFICNLATIYASQKETIEKHFAQYADSSKDAFSALNTALAKDGAYIRIAAGTKVNEPVHIINLIANRKNLLVNSRNLILVEKSAKVDIVETFVSLDSDAGEKLFTNHLSEVILEENAQATYCRIQAEENNVTQVNTTQVQQHKGSNFTTHTFSLSGALVRNNLSIVLADEHCESHLYGLYLPRTNELMDNHTLVDHRKPNCYSNELYKGIMSNDSTAVFNGKIYVRPDAQKTNAYQSNKNMLVDDGASVNTKPQLEIYADDVKCSHGSSTGRLDEEAMFYLRSRGIGETAAKKLLLKAFAEEVVNTIAHEPLKAYIDGLIENRFA
ncbi:MAG TPA: Fe-S cluster assembly protein SufD [Bacteroidia bacterium]|nr:Fe-S cluster assembly protein SufD [Bacteroidia bacterium]HRH06996.1 Fe-S cluster assembly protein SufD [Bacteroidia bacterium]HRH63023.1 Fe-S cluster assembly protein SufD [Bacteroidia bacterium]